MKLQLPNVDLSLGPPWNPSSSIESARNASIPETCPESRAPSNVSTGRVTDSVESQASVARLLPPKRSHSALTDTDTDKSLNSEAQSIDRDLDMLSLNLGSREKNYLGSSSGLLFARLLHSQRGGLTERNLAQIGHSITVLQNAKQEYNRIHGTLVLV